MLVQVCKTLDTVPDERFIWMKLDYHDNTPDSYEPPYFVPITIERPSTFPREPFSM